MNDELQRLFSIYKSYVWFHGIVTWSVDEKYLTQFLSLLFFFFFLNCYSGMPLC